MGATEDDGVATVRRVNTGFIDISTSSYAEMLNNYYHDTPWAFVL
jgi:hypothetical protein